MGWNWWETAVVHAICAPRGWCESDVSKPSGWGGEADSIFWKRRSLTFCLDVICDRCSWHCGWPLIIHTFNPHEDSKQKMEGFSGVASELGFGEVCQNRLRKFAFEWASPAIWCHLYIKSFQTIFVSTSPVLFEPWKGFKWFEDILKVHSLSPLTHTFMIFHVCRPRLWRTSLDRWQRTNRLPLFTTLRHCHLTNP